MTEKEIKVKISKQFLKILFAFENDLKLASFKCSQKGCSFTTGKILMMCILKILFEDNPEIFNTKNQTSHEFSAKISNLFTTIGMMSIEILEEEKMTELLEKYFYIKKEEKK